MCHNFNKEIFILISWFTEPFRKFSSKKHVFQINVTFSASMAKDPFLLIKEFSIRAKHNIKEIHLPLKLSYSVLRF